MGVEVHDLGRAVKYEEERASIEKEYITSNSVKNDEDDAEHDPSTSNQVHEQSEPAEGDIAASAQPSDTRSRQSSVAGTRASSKVKQPETDQDPDAAQLVDWFDLPLLVKLETIHTLAEWQFQNPTRLRHIMKSDDEIASWVSRSAMYLG